MPGNPEKLKKTKVVNGDEASDRWGRAERDASQSGKVEENKGH